MIDQGLAPLSVIYRTFGAFSPYTNKMERIKLTNEIPVIPATSSSNWMRSLQDSGIRVCVIQNRFLRFLVVSSAVSAKKSGVFKKQFHWFCSTIPLISFNNFNGFVQQFQWIRFSNLPLLFLPSAIIAVLFRQFRLGKPVCSCFIFRSSGV